MKLAVVGSRTGFNREFVNRILNEFFERYPSITSIVSGGARGVDRFAEEWAAGRLPVIIIKPDWRKYGKSAGAIRNQKIIDACDHVLAFWDGQSKGTKITLDMALKAEKQITLIPIAL